MVARGNKEIRTRAKTTPLAAKSILIIDDNSDILEFNRMVLEMEGFKVFTALSGSAALTLLDEIDEPALILLDMLMEDMSGPEFLEVLQAQNPEVVERVPIVILSAVDQVPPTRAKGFIRKPVDIDRFLATVHHFIDTEEGTSKPDSHH